MSNFENVRGLADTKESAKEHLLENIKGGATIEQIKTATVMFAYLVQDTELKQNADVYLEAIKEIEESIDEDL